MRERPFLTAGWNDLVMLNFEVPVELVEPFTPVGTEPDLHDGRAYISIVGFRFQDVRLLGVRVPGHANFDEVNLRFYVKRVVEGETRRGVVFVREIVPRRAVAIVANRLYYENYVTRPMRSRIVTAGPQFDAGDTLEYAWSSRSRPLLGGNAFDANRFTVRVCGPLRLPAAGSLEGFIVEHYWGYNRGRERATWEYRVDHRPWRIAPAECVEWTCDVQAVYHGPFAGALTHPPTNVLVADGSNVEVYRGQAIR